MDNFFIAGSYFTSANYSKPSQAGRLRLSPSVGVCRGCARISAVCFSGDALETCCFPTLAYLRKI